MRQTRQSTPFAILALLTLKPMSGYELKKMMQSSIAHFWTESYGQIYPALQKLAKDGLALRKTEKTAGKPDKQVYRVTAKGRSALRRWLAEEPRSQPPRSELLLKLFFFSEMPSLDAARHNVEAARERSRAELAAYSKIEDQLRSNRKDHPGLPFWLMTLNFGRKRSQAVAEWADETLHGLEAIAHAR